MRRRHSTWERRYVLVLLLLDLASGAAAALIAHQARFSGRPDAHMYVQISALAPLAWLGTLAANHAYDRRTVGCPEEFRRVLRGFAGITAAVAIASYAFRAEIARGYVVLVLPIAAALSLLSRALTRGALRRARARGMCLQRVLAVGSPAAVHDLVKEIHRDTAHGMRVVGACLAAGAPRPLPDQVPQLGGLSDVAAAAVAAGVEAVAVSAAEDIDARTLRLLSWEVQRIGVELIVAPGLIDVAGTRIHVRPLAGLPLLHVEEPRLTGTRRLAKDILDRSLALAGLLLLSWFFVAIAVAVRLDSPGPALFRQHRVGRQGRGFTLYKFRSMYSGAEELLGSLRPRNEADGGVLFKLRKDPRVTPVGAFLRRCSLDELPQLLNVLKGDMSLVGPRPLLPSEVANYPDDIRRRLLVKPGLTGLWQISGRSDLSWEESVRLDLIYVENWTMTLDFAILWRTARVVLQGKGAY